MSDSVLPNCRAEGGEEDERVCCKEMNQKKNG